MKRGILHLDPAMSASLQAMVKNAAAIPAPLMHKVDSLDLLDVADLQLSYDEMEILLDLLPPPAAENEDVVNALRTALTELAHS